MHPPRLRSIVLGLALAACSPAPEQPTTATAQRESIAPKLGLDQVHVYAIDWRTEAARDLGGGQVSGGLVLRGEFAVQAVEHGPRGTWVSVWFPALSEAQLVVQGELVALDPSELVGVHAELLVDETGEVREAAFPPTSAPIFRELMLGVIARYDLRGATTGAQPRTLRGGHGLVEVVYQRDAEGRITRELAELVRFDTAPGLELDPSQLVSEATLELDDQRVPIQIHQRDSVATGELTAEDSFTLERLRTDPAGPRERLVDPIVLDPTAAPDQAAIAEALDRQLAEGVAIDDLEIALTTMDGGVLPRPGFVSSAAAYLRVEPTQIQALVELTASAGGNGRQLAFDLLAATGTPAAQTAMWLLLSDPRASTWLERPYLIQRFAFVAAPTVETGTELLDLLAAAQAADDTRLTIATLHPLGTVAGRVQDPALAERMHQTLTRAAASEQPSIRAAAFSGLGNARRRTDVPRFIAGLADPDGDVRVEAAAALRTHPVPEAEQALLDALADTDVAVATRALAVLHERHYEGKPSAELIERATSGRYNLAIGRALASALAGSLDVDGVPAALAGIGERTDDPELARELALLLRG